MGHRLRSFLILLISLMFLGAGCRPDVGPSNGSECEDDSSCTNASKPYCFENSCVACVTTNDCNCHEACVDSHCEPLGADNSAHQLNAHGNWSGTPGSGDYVYNGTCEIDADCGVGQRCNPLTAGCILAADFAAPCANGESCPAGPHGELLVCEPMSRLCFPAARCDTTANCCGMDNFRCDEGASMCRPIGSECTPPDTITNDCPFEPRLSQECDPGTFCGPMGECVACVCNGDCAVGQKCYAATASCKSVDYCENDGECGSGLTCDEDSRSCVSYCDATNEATVCPEEYYCNLSENFCEPLADRPCTPDEHAPNHSPQTASAIALPELGESTTVTNLTLCDDSDDYFQIEIEAGIELTVTMSSVSNITGVFEILADDGITSLAQGALGALGGELLRFTASRTDTYFLRVTRSGGTTGYYNLTLAVSQGELCDDPWENTGSNDTIESASPLYAATTTINDDCARGTLGGNQVVICEANVLTLCDGDVDYYSLSVTGGSRVSVALSDYSGDLDLAIFGPFNSLDSALITDRLAEDVSNGPSKEVAATAREDSVFVVQILRDFGERTGYAINVLVDTPSTACVEDSYDAQALNDQIETASNVHLQESEDTTIELNVCIADIEWLNLTIDGQNPLPAGYQLSASLVPNSAHPNTLTLALMSDHETVLAGSNNPDEPEHEATLALTTGQNLYARISGGSQNPSHAAAEVVFHLVPPPPCTQSSHFAPSLAQNVAPLPWSAAQDSYTVVTEESLCSTEDDWYTVSVPTGFQLVATAAYNPANAGLALELYSDAVSSQSENTHGLENLVGRLAVSQVPNRSFQSAWSAPSEGDTIYVRVANDLGWPVLGYELTLELSPTTCSDDAFESNDAVTEATHLVPLPSTLEQATDVLNEAHLSTCGGDADWYQTRLLPGDSLSAAVYFDASEVNLGFDLFGLEDAITPIASGVQNTSGRVDLAYQFNDDNPAGSYPLLVQTLSGDARYYGIELQVVRACSDDALEPTAPLVQTDIALPFDEANLILCADDDWYTFEPPAGNFTICAFFEHDDGDIDLSLFENGPALTPVATSMTKNDLEVISVESDGSATFTLNVFLDDRDSVITGYRLVVGTGVDCGAL